MSQARRLRGVIVDFDDCSMILESNTRWKLISDLGAGMKMPQYNWLPFSADDSLGGLDRATEYWLLAIDYCRASFRRVFAGKPRWNSRFAGVLPS